MRARADLRRPFSVIVAAEETRARARLADAGFGAFGFGVFRAAAAGAPLLLLALLFDEALLEPPPPLALEKEKPRAVVEFLFFFQGEKIGG